VRILVGHDEPVNEARSSYEDALWAALRESPARLDPGLSEVEIHSIEEHFEFRFAPDHRLMLSLALPLEDRHHWPEWRNGTDTDLRDRLAWPVEGLLFDVEPNNLWHPNCGPRPNQVNEARGVAADAMRSVPPRRPPNGRVPARGWVITRAGIERLRVVAAQLQSLGSLPCEK
jgi:hypothetical protein